MKSILVTSFIILISLGICEAQTAQTIPVQVKLKSRVEGITTQLTQQLNLSALQQEKVRVVFEKSMQQMQVVVEQNNGDRKASMEQIQLLVQEREVAMKSILTLHQLSIYQSDRKQ